MSVETKEAEFDADVFDSMLYGSFEENDSDVNEDEAGTADNEDDEYQEDTDQEDESEAEEELDDTDDGQNDEDSEDEDEDEEEDALVEDYDSDDETGDTEDDDETEEDDDADEADSDGEGKASDEAGEESEDGTETEEGSDGETQDTDEVDYKAFYDAVVNTEFVVNGKKVKGFSDPQKIIQSQQMAGGFSEKMAGFKQYRPFMAPLKERGMLDDQAKFDLAMNLIDGDKEAIKEHLKSLSIDPLDLDMESINYEAKPTVASQDSLIIEDVMERAKASGIEDRVRQVVGNEWDAESFQEFVANDAVRNDLLNHIETGVYDQVQEKMNELSRLDYNGSYGAMNTIAKYRTAVGELQKEANANLTKEPVKQAAKVHKDTASKQTVSVKAEKAKIIETRKAEEYKVKAAKREEKLSQQRKKAASMSKKKAKPKAKPKFDPMKVEGEELDNLMDLLIAGGR